MRIKDLYGKEITVTDIAKAVAQTGTFKGFSHINAASVQAISDEERKRYWTDMHNKLLQLQSNLK